MKLSKLVRTLLLPITLSGCQALDAQLFNDVKIKQANEYRCDASKETLENTLWEIWNSGFLVKDEILKREIENNKYGIMTSEYAKRECEDCLAVFRKNHNPQWLLLREDLFCHDKGYKTDYDNRDLKRRAMVIHEISQDFWDHILPEEKKQQFSTEVRKFHTEMLNAKTTQEKLEFLQHIGIENPSKDLYRNFFALELRRKWFKNAEPAYKDEDYFGEELYSFILEYTYMGKIIIPKQLRPFYQGIISETALNRNKI